MVTGATGLLGGVLLERLVQAGYRNIRALYRKAPKPLPPSLAGWVEWVEGDVLDLVALDEALQGCTQVFHCAALISYRGRDRRRLLAVNREGTANLVNLSLHHGVKRFVHVSSIAALGRRRGQPVQDESTLWERHSWNSPYAESKHLSELEVWRGVEEGLPAVVVNPSVLVGYAHPGHSLARVFRLLRRGLKHYPPGGTGFVDVEDVARFLILLSESELVGERFILNAENLSYEQFFRWAAEALGVPPPAKRLTPLQATLLEGFLRLKALFGADAELLTPQLLRQTLRTFSYDNRKSLNAFDFQYTPIRQSLQRACRAFLQDETNARR